MHGRLADPDCTIGTDPRADPRMVKALAPFGLDGHMPVPTVTPDAPMEDRLAVVAATEKRMGGVLEELAQNLPDRQRRRHHDDDDRRRRRQRHRVVHHPPDPCRGRVCPASCTSTAAGWPSTV